MLPIIGAKDYIEPRGFFIHECPACHTQRVFSVYDTRRKLTLYFIPTLNVRSQQVMECTTCHGRWGIPDDQVNALQRQLMTQEQITERLYEERKPPEQPRRTRTFYQVLQVDQEAERDVIEAAFRRLALKYHPDTNNSAEAQGRMREILQARDILLDEVKRAEYDRSLGIVRRVEALRPEEV